MKVVRDRSVPRRRRFFRPTPKSQIWTGQNRKTCNISPEAPIFLTPPQYVVKIDNMTARLITRFKDISPEGDLMEMVVWRLVEPVPPCNHPFKYRLAFVANGERIIGFNNERGKGDHCHVEGKERPYILTDVDRLIEDFIGEVERWRNAR